ncbi:MAG TPA: hypothetical protein VFT91_03825 [Dehalococcoidia bacterium]|nr:hypothetical protein [Dehalococcoidia bacterium]
MWGVALVVVALVIAFSVVLLVTRSRGDVRPPIAGVPCERIERLEYHVHAHVTLFVEGQEVSVAASIGITRTCIYWLHTHAADGIIHVEAPAPRQFVLSQFFSVWGQPLSATALLDKTVSPGHEIRTFVNGQPFDGDPTQISLDDKTSIVLEYGPPFVPPPPSPFGQ